MGVRQGKMGEIEDDNRGRVRECMRKVLLEWLHGNGRIPATWQGLIDILKTTLLEEPDVAKQIVADIIEKVRHDIN